jgi:hypothetical protein
MTFTISAAVPMALKLRIARDVRRCRDECAAGAIRPYDPDGYGAGFRGYVAETAEWEVREGFLSEWVDDMILDFHSPARRRLRGALVRLWFHLAELELLEDV